MSSSSSKRLRIASALALALALVLSQVSGSAFVTSTFAAFREHLHHRGHSRLLQPRRHAVDNSIEGVEIIDAQTGAVLVSINDTTTFNPASNTKLATSLAVLQKFGPDYRFKTEVRIDGTVDAHGTLHGDLYVTGHYMLFGDDEARELIKILNSKGIKSVSGDLYVSPDFSMNLGAEGIDGGKRLKTILAPRRGASVRIRGDVKVGLPPATATLVATHNSPPLKHILKRMNCPSDNDMAERFGELIGGPDALTQFVINLGAPAAEVHFSSTSGLFVNRISPRAMMIVLKALRAELAKHNLTFADIMGVAGVDHSTVGHRLNAPGQAGSVIAKTGSLPETDNGASALSGEIHTKLGVYLFVIFDMHGTMSSFRARQNERVTEFERTHGGPQPIAYKPILPGFASEAFWQ